MNDPLRDYQKLARLCQAMRIAQRRYFRTRMSSDLNDAKLLEQEVDDLLRDLKSQSAQGELGAS